jgi:hypothetical protein
MLSPFLYLVSCSIKNRILVRVRRLRQPRYLIGSVVGVLYLYTMTFRRLMAPSGSRGPGLVAILNRAHDPVEFLATMFLFVIAASAWILPATRPLQFSRPEVQFLFQAPVGRRQLVHFKLLRAQVGVLFSSAVATLLLRPGTFAAAWTFFLGLWLAFALVQLHLTGVALRRQSLLQHGAAGVRHQWVSMAVAVAVVGIIVQALVVDWHTISTLPAAQPVISEVRRVLFSGAPGVVLWPIRVLVGLPLSVTPQDFLKDLPFVLLLFALNYAWVIQSDAAFEEASAADAERRAEQRTAPRSVRRNANATAPPFALGATGRPEIAILWKNLIVLGRYASLKVLLRFAPLFVVLAIMFSRRSGPTGLTTVVAMICLCVAAFTILLGPQTTRNDLRQDLGHLAILKTWPLSGAALLRGELLAPTLVLAIMTWLFVAAGAIMLGGQPIGGRGYVLSDRVAFMVAAMAIAPGLILAHLVVVNAVAVLFPAWAVIGTSRSRGIDAMGQRMLMFAGVMLTLVIAVLPAAVAAALVGGLLYAATNTIPVVIPAVVLGLVMIVECVVTIELLGRVLDRTDVTALEPIE